MKVLHSRNHWLAVTVVLGVALLTMSLAHGQQRNDAGSVFQGRPAMAGAQSGTGPMAGPPQGGIGIEGQENASIALRPPAAVRDDKDIVPRDRDSDVIKRERDSGVAKENRSTTKKAKRAAKSVAKQARHGVPTIDSTRTPG